MKKHRRLVVRNNLADLERAVRALEGLPERWHLDREADSISLVAALDTVAIKKQIAVAMFQDLPD